jgi:hypothetical protein
MNKKGQLTWILAVVIMLFLFIIAMFMIRVINEGNAGAKQGECVKLCEDKDYTWDSNTDKVCVCNINSTTKESFSI